MNTTKALTVTKIFAPFFIGCLGTVLFFEYYFNWQELLNAQKVSNGIHNTTIVFDMPKLTFWGGLLPAIAIFAACAAASILILKSSAKKRQLVCNTNLYIFFAVLDCILILVTYSILFFMKQMWLLQPIIITLLLISSILLAVSIIRSLNKASAVQ